METLCLVSFAFRDIALEVAFKAFGIERGENHANYPRCACDCEACDGPCANVTFCFLIQHHTCYCVRQITVFTFIQTKVPCQSSA